MPEAAFCPQGRFFIEPPSWPIANQFRCGGIDSIDSTGQEPDGCHSPLWSSVPLAGAQCPAVRVQNCRPVSRLARTDEPHEPEGSPWNSTMELDATCSPTVRCSPMRCRFRMKQLGWLFACSPPLWD